MEELQSWMMQKWHQTKCARGGRSLGLTCNPFTPLSTGAKFKLNVPQEEPPHIRGFFQLRTSSRLKAIEH